MFQRSKPTGRMRKPDGGSRAGKHSVQVGATVLFKSRFGDHRFDGEKAIVRDVWDIPTLPPPGWSAPFDAHPVGVGLETLKTGEFFAAKLDECVSA